MTHELSKFKSPSQYQRFRRQAIVTRYGLQGKTVRMIQRLLLKIHRIDASIGTIQSDLDIAATDRLRRRREAQELRAEMRASV
jgi:hypothetical protein